MLDEVAIFNRALSYDEIYKIYYFLFFGHPLDVATAAARPAPVSVTQRGGLLCVQANDSRPLGEMALYNVQGQMLEHRNTRTTNFTFDLSPLPGQVFYLRLARNNTAETLKIAKF